MPWSSLSSDGEEEWEEEELPFSWESIFPEPVLSLFLFRQMKDSSQCVQELKQTQQVILGTGLLPVCVEKFNYVKEEQCMTLFSAIFKKKVKIYPPNHNNAFLSLRSAIFYSMEQFHAVTEKLCYETAMTMMSKEGMQTIHEDIDEFLELSGYNKLLPDCTPKEKQECRRAHVKITVHRGRGLEPVLLRDNGLVVTTPVPKQDVPDFITLMTCNGRVKLVTGGGQEILWSDVDNTILLVKLQFSLCFLDDKNYGVKAELVKLTKEEQAILQQFQPCFDSHPACLLPYGCTLYHSH